MERHALLIYARGGRRAWPRRGCGHWSGSGSEAAVLCQRAASRHTLAGLPGQPTDDQLRQVWDAVLRLHRRAGHAPHPDRRPHPAHRPGGTGEVMLLDPGNGDVAASELQLRLDLAQLLAETGAAGRPGAGRRRRQDRARRASCPAWSRCSSRSRCTARPGPRCGGARTCCPRCASGWSAAPRTARSPPVQLERFRLRTIVTLVIGVVAADILVGQLTKVSFGDLLRNADWRWTLVALGLSVPPTWAPPGRCRGSCWRSSASAGPSWPSWPGRSSRWSPRPRSAAWR